MDRDAGRRVGVTGSTGFLGRSLVATLRREGFDVVEFRRTATEVDGADAVRELDLARDVDGRVFEGISCLIHAAWDLRETDPRRAWERNVDGSKRVVAAALGAGVGRVIFVSSMSAYFGTRQDYGLMKLAVERTVLEAGQVVVRPGLVYGPESGGMALTLAKLARLPVIPVFRGAQQFTLHLDDFLAAMVTLVRRDHVPSGVIGLANESPVPFRQIMRSIADDAGTSARMVVVPWRAVLGALRVARALRIPLPVRPDSLRGLIQPAPSVPGGDVARELGLSFRPFAGFHRASPEPA